MLLQVIPVLLLLLLLWELNLAPSSFCRDPAPLPNNYQPVWGKCVAWLWYIINTSNQYLPNFGFWVTANTSLAQQKNGSVFLVANSWNKLGIAVCEEGMLRVSGSWLFSPSVRSLPLPPHTLPLGIIFSRKPLSAFPPILPWLYTIWKQPGKYSISGLPLWDKYEWKHLHYRDYSENVLETETYLYLYNFTERLKVGTYFFVEKRNVGSRTSSKYWIKIVGNNEWEIIWCLWEEG